MNPLQQFIAASQDMAGEVTLLLFAAAVVVLFYNIVRMILGGDSAPTLTGIATGLIGIFVMTSLWGIIDIMQTTLDIPDTGPIVPQRIEAATIRAW